MTTKTGASFVWARTKTQSHPKNFNWFATSTLNTTTTITISPALVAQKP